jgi:membrane associated rhomboid family serine protease
MSGEPQLTFGLPKPGKAVTGFLVAIVAVWLLFALGLNWGGASEETLAWVVGSDRILHGEIWRLVTGPMLQKPSGAGSVSHLLTALMGIYFLGPSLEERWGAKRFVFFVGASGVFAAASQVLVGAILPQVHQPVFFGALGMVDAVAVGWALTFKSSQVRLFFVLPVSGYGFLAFIAVMNVLYVIGSDVHYEGLVTPVGGMIAGWLFGETSPVRRWWLTRTYKKLAAESAALRDMRVGGPKLKVIEGGLGAKNKPPADKRYLN